MFKGTTNNTPNKNGRVNEINSPDKLNRIVEGTTIEGEIKSKSNIRIDGVLKGSILTKGRLVVGSSGIIEGDVVCQNSDVEGVLLGKISVNELLSLKATAKITGDIITNKLAIEPGANFSGTVSMGAVIKDIKHGEKEAQPEREPEKEKTA